MDALRIATGQDILAEIRGKLGRHAAAIDHALDTLERLVEEPEAVAWLGRIKAMRARYALSAARALELLEDGRQAEAVCLMDTETLPALNAVQGTLQGLLELQRGRVPEGAAGAGRRIDSALTLMKVMDGAPEAAWKSPLRADT